MEEKDNVLNNISFPTAKISDEIIRPKKVIDMLIMVKRELRQMQWIHMQSSIYYERLSTWYLSIPALMLTCISGVLSFIAASNMINGNAQNQISLVVGCCGVISSTMQSFITSKRLPAHIEAHRSAADQYQQLITKIEFEIAQPNEINFVNELETKKLQIQNSCKFYPPKFIIDKYSNILRNGYEVE